MHTCKFSLLLVLKSLSSGLRKGPSGSVHRLTCELTALGSIAGLPPPPHDTHIHMFGCGMIIICRF